MRAEVSVPVALGTAAVVWGVYQIALPNLADVRAAQPNDQTLARSERMAYVIAVGTAAGIAILAQDTAPFVVGGLLATALTWAHRHANQYDATTGSVWNRDQYLGARRYTVQADS